MNVADKNRAIESAQFHGPEIDADLYLRLARLRVNVQDHSIETNGLVNLGKSVDDALWRESSQRP